MKKKSLKRGFSERLDFKRELIRDTTQGLPSKAKSQASASEEESDSIQFDEEPKKNRRRKVEPKLASIKVVGVGGGGNNAVNQMAEEGLEGVRLVAVNTDIQSLKKSLAEEKVQIGLGLTRGLGTGGNPQLGEDAARQDEEDLLQIIEGSDLLFVTACLGGGTGTGAAPVIAELAREAGVLTVGVVTKPFHFEGGRRMRQAEEGIAKLQKVVDALIVIPNDRLLQVSKKDTSLQEAFKQADLVLYQAVRGITDLITSPQDINLDLADLKTVLTEAGKVLIGIGHGRGREKAKHAAEAAIYSPLLEISIEGAKNIILSISSSPDMTLQEVMEIMDIVTKAAGTETDILWGNKVDDSLSNEVLVTVIATRFSQEEKMEEEKEAELASPWEKELEERFVVEEEIDKPAFLREPQRKTSAKKSDLDDVFSFFKNRGRE
ncbi:MAG: cell division protein FtsZ [Candidatus Atribacteria bacterium]|nr:cell division protein FtsZ [Candidatus Atribacteria bacterium]